ncbi:hypothetical protein LTR53_012628 [Teratosphaeriaceae sp. CCFEE 6253]|nr:hypothetical protein LTR53_012628 [Teratosphaeriaceae sp. CCFEE 6253]
MGSTEEVTTPSWQTKTKQYRDHQAAKIPPEWRLDPSFTAGLGPTSTQIVLPIPSSCGILNPLEVEITEDYDATALLDKLAHNQLTSVAVTTAFCKRAAIAQQLTNCLTETFFDRALKRAQECDDYLAANDKAMGPLHGLPISLKDSFHVKDIPSTIGYVSFLDHPPATSDAALVQVLLSLGAVLYVKTNIPQSLMTADSDNHVFGRTLNPHNLSLGAGGSSGGEGALLAMRGSVLGVGTDIAGSIRIPAYVNGTFGLRPTAARVPYGGQASPARAGSFGIAPCAGPLARSVRDVQLFMGSVLGFDGWGVDPSVISAPWRAVAVEKTQKLRIGYLLEDPKYPAHPPVLRALKTAITNLESAGHTLIPLAPDLPSSTLLSEAMESAFTHFAMDPSKTSLRHIIASGEPLVASIPTASMPELKHFQPSVDDVFRLNVERAGYQTLFRDLWVKHGLDVLVMPMYQATAVPHDRDEGEADECVMQHPAMTLPYLKAEKSADADHRRDVSYTPPYVPDEVEGAPCGLQILGRPMRDEELVRHCQILADALEIKPLS